MSQTTNEDAQSRHALFDETSLVTEFRNEFIPGEKLYGLFLAEGLRRQFEQSPPVELPQMMARASGQGGTNSPATLKPLSALVDRDPTVGDVTMLVLLLSAAAVRSLSDVQVSRQLLKSPDGENDIFQVRIIGARQFAGSRCRLMVLSPIVRSNLMKVAGLQGELTFAKLEELLDDKKLRTHVELARYIAALPELEDTINGHGDCTLKLSLPDAPAALPNRSWFVLLIK